MRPEDITVEVRSLALGRLGQVDLEYITDLKLIKRFCNVGAWTMSLPVGFDMADELAKPGRGITVTGPNGFQFSGPMISAIHVQDTDDPMGTWQYTGADDNIYLADALAFPEPSNPDTETQSESHDVRTGVAEDVLRGYVDANIGPSAPSVRQALVPFALGAYAGGLGAVVTGRARFPQLGQLLSDVASAGGVGFDMVQVGNEVQFVVYEPQDRSGEIRMDIDNDLLDKVEYGLGAPGGTRYVVAGQGQGVERRIIQVTDSLAEAAEELWGRRVEVFKDRRDTDDDTELVQEGTEGVQTNGRTVTSLAVTPADDTTMVYGKDWFLGDIVTVVVGGQELQTIVTEAIISISEDGVLTAATIGDPTGFDYESKLAAKQESQEQRLAFLEKNAEGGGGAAGGAPAGSVLAWVIDTIPAGWAECDGGEVSRNTDYFTLVGTKYGPGNGTTTVNVPDLRGRVIVGNNVGDADFDIVGETGGAKSHTHQHMSPVSLASGQIRVSRPNADAMDRVGNYDLGSPAIIAGNSQSIGTGAAGDMENWVVTSSSSSSLQPYMALKYIIKLNGDVGSLDPTIESVLIDRMSDAEDAINALESAPNIQGQIPSSVQVGSGSASVAADGTVTFTGASSVSLNSVLPSDGHYMVGFEAVAASASGIYTRGRAGTTDSTSSSYNYLASSVLWDVGPVRSQAFGTTAFGHWKPSSGSAGDFARGTMFLHKVGNGVTQTLESYNSESGNRRRWLEGGDASVTGLDGLSFIVSTGVMTGKVKVTKLS